MKYFYLFLLLTIPHICVDETVNFYDQAKSQLSSLVDITENIKKDCLVNTVHIDDAAC